MKCICCSESLLKHIGNNRIYWFCRQCRQPMPGSPGDRVSASGQDASPLAPVA